MYWLRCLFLLLAVVISAGSQDNIINSYPRVHALTQSPPTGELRIMCQKQIEGKYVSFLTLDGKTALLAAYTEKKLKNPDQHIKLRFLYTFPDSATNPNQPLVRPWHGDVLDWGYIFDRNGDGKIDYIAFLIGTLIVSTEELPKASPEGLIQGDGQLRWALEHYRMVFTHWADDNFDGHVDGIVYDDTGRAKISVVERWLLMRSTRFDGYLDEGFTFAVDPSQPTAKVARSTEGYPLRSGGFERDHFGEADLEHRTRHFTLVNGAATACHLSANAFSR